MKLSKNSFKTDILILPPFPTSNHLKHILERDVASLQVVRGLALASSLMHLLMLTGWQVYITSHQKP